MYDYLRWHTGDDVDVHLKADASDLPGPPAWVIGGVLADTYEHCCVVRHQSQGEFIIPYDSIRFVRLESRSLAAAFDAARSGVHPTPTTTPGD